MGGATGVVKLLLEAGADPAEQNSAGETALSLAVLMGHWDCAEALLQSPGGARAVQVGALEGACLFCYPASVRLPFVIHPSRSPFNNIGPKKKSN